MFSYKSRNRESPNSLVIKIESEFVGFFSYKYGEFGQTAEFLILIYSCRQGQQKSQRKSIKVRASQINLVWIAFQVA